MTVDRRTYLPRRIEWREAGRRISETRFTVLDRQRGPVGPDAWAMSEHPGAHVVQLTSTGERVRVLAVTRGSLPRGARWLGPRYEGRPARVAAVRLTGGNAVRISYGPLVVWNYDTVVPPAVVELRGPAVKTFEIPGGIVHASFAADVGVVADATFRDGNVAVVSRSGDKEDAVHAVQRLVRAE